MEPSWPEHIVPVLLPYRSRTVPRIRHPSFHGEVILIQKGITIRVAEHDFMHIQAILVSPLDVVYYRGLWLRSKRAQTEIFQPSSLENNKVAIQVNTYDSGSGRAALEDCAIVIRAPDLIERQECVFTNDPFVNRHPSRIPPALQENDFWASASFPAGTIMCDYIVQTDLKVVQKQKTKTQTRLRVTCLIEEQCTALGGVPVPCADLISRWRGVQRFQDFTYASFFTGPGGAARGAVAAGATLSYCVEMNKDAVATLKENFPGVKVYGMDVATWCKAPLTPSRVVVCIQISPPCQFVSAGNRHKKSRKNNAGRLAGQHIKRCVEHTRPMYVQMEQVSRVMAEDGGKYYHQYLNQLAWLGFSFSCEVIDMSDFGNVHARKRLIISASCPGETLPSAAQPTHGPSLIPKTTVREVVDALDMSDMPLHMTQSRRVERTAWDPEYPLPSLVCSTGLYQHKLPQQYHWSGKRTWCFAEWAAFQSMYDHVFCGSRHSIQTQIGNMVPPVYSKASTEAIIHHYRCSEASNMPGRSAMLKDWVDDSDEEYDDIVLTASTARQMSEPENRLVDSDDVEEDDDIVLTASIARQMSEREDRIVDSDDAEEDDDIVLTASIARQMRLG